jgi:hypothetical protein
MIKRPAPSSGSSFMELEEGMGDWEGGTKGVEPTNGVEGARGAEC